MCTGVGMGSVLTYWVTLICQGLLNLPPISLCSNEYNGRTWSGECDSNDNVVRQSLSVENHVIKIYKSLDLLPSNSHPHCIIISLNEANNCVIREMELKIALIFMYIGIYVSSVKSSGVKVPSTCCLRALCGELDRSTQLGTLLEKLGLCPVQSSSGQQKAGLLMNSRRLLPMWTPQ